MIVIYCCFINICKVLYFLLPGYGRRRIIPRRIYPRHPIGGGIIDPYPGGSIIGDPYVDPYIGTDTLGGGVYPAGGIGVIGGRRRPVIVDDNSRRDAQDINVSNNNVNVERHTGSNNVHVNQGKLFTSGTVSIDFIIIVLQMLI
jgi:hypothetical protein